MLFSIVIISTCFYFVKIVNSIDLFRLSGSKKIIKKLLSKMDDIDAKTRHGLTPLHLAATYEGSVHFRLETLVENGAKVNERSQYGSTPLDFAAAFGKSF